MIGYLVAGSPIGWWFAYPRNHRNPWIKNDFDYLAKLQPCFFTLADGEIPPGGLSAEGCSQSTIHPDLGMMLKWNTWNKN